MAKYSKVEYWDERYLSKAGLSNEWYQPYSSFRHLLTPEQLSPSLGLSGLSRPLGALSAPIRPFPPRAQCRVLILGCGNSRLGEDMLNDGWTGGITNVDFSKVVIEQMKAKYNDDFYNQLWKDRKLPAKGDSGFSKMKFIVGDITKRLPFEDESFDLIICKGSFDAVLCSAGSVANIREMVKESVRLLTYGSGVFFLVTTGNPDSRVVFLERDNEDHDLTHYWNGVIVQTVERAKLKKNDFVYICRKRSKEARLPFGVSNSAVLKENNKYAENVVPGSRVPSKKISFADAAAGATDTRSGGSLSGTR